MNPTTVHRTSVNFRANINDQIYHWFDINGNREMEASFGISEMNNHF